MISLEEDSGCGEFLIMEVDYREVKEPSFSELGVPQDGVLEVALLIIRVFHIYHTEASRVAVCPFEVVH